MGVESLLEKIARAVGVTPDASVTIGAVFMLYKKARPRGRAWQMERNLLRPFVLRFWRHDADSLTVAEWRDHRRDRKRHPTRTGKPPCDLTINLELSRAKGMLSWAVREGELDRNPLADCKKVKTRTRRESWFTADQIDRLIDHAEYLRWRHQRITFAALVAVMADTGLRISEALGLRWDRITLRGITSVFGKGSKSRIIAFTPRTMAYLARIDRHPNDPRVFLNWRRHTSYNPSTVRSWFRQCIDAAGLHGVKADGDLALVPHVLRHSAASIADERGAPATWISAMLGHSQLSTTQVYLHRSNADAALRMAAIMGERKPPRRASMKKDLVKLERRRVSFVS